MNSVELQKQLMLDVFEATKEKIFIDNCRGCINDAINKLKEKAMTKAVIKQNCDYKLKQDVLIYFEHQHYSNANLTNAIAEKILKVRGQEKNFEIIPTVEQPKEVIKAVEVKEVIEQPQYKKRNGKSK